VRRRTAPHSSAKGAAHPQAASYHFFFNNNTLKPQAHSLGRIKPRSNSHYVSIAVIPAWMPESSHKDVNLVVAIKPFSNTYATDKLPSMALDSGIHAGMTSCLSALWLITTIAANPQPPPMAGMRNQ